MKNKPSQTMLKDSTRHQGLGTGFGNEITAHPSKAVVEPRLPGGHSREAIKYGKTT